MKKSGYKNLTLLIVLCLSILMTGCNKPAAQSENSPSKYKTIKTVHADYEKYTDLPSMLNDAEMIFKGTVVKVNDPVKLVEFYINDDKNRPYYAPYTISEIKVEKIIKGNLKPGDMIKIKQLGGIIDHTKWVSEDDSILTENTEGVFFIDPFKIQADYPSSILLFEQGVFKIKDGVIYPNELQKDLIGTTKVDDFIKKLLELNAMK